MLGLCVVNASVSRCQSLVMRGLCLGTHNRFQICIGSPISSEVDCSPTPLAGHVGHAHAESSSAFN